jgi:hypothetical protein
VLVINHVLVLIIAKRDLPLLHHQTLQSSLHCVI